MEVERVQIPAPQVEVVSIQSHYDQCISSFTQLHNHVEHLNQDRSDKQLFPIIGLSTELGRLRMWAGNTGAHQTGLLSLDHRLREVPDIHEEISELLKELNSGLDEIFNLTAYGASVSPELSIGKDSTEGPSDVDGALQADDFMALVNDISHIITCLYKLFIAIRNPAPPDRLQKLAMSIEDSQSESRDFKYLAKNFQLTPDYLLERLRKGNTKRRQLLRYYQLHHNKLARFVDLPSQDDLKPTPPIRLIFWQHDDIADSCPISPEEPGTVSTALKQQSTPQTSVRIPPPPNFDAAYNGQPFECPYCFTLITLDNMRSWKKHVYRDLRPYACMHKDCRNWDILYESRHDWYDHELSTHLREWYCKTCARLFARASEFKEHLRTIHEDIVRTEIISVEDIVELCGRAKAPPEACEFCGEAVAGDTRRKHLSRHMKGFALLALPKVGCEDRELEERGQAAGTQGTDTNYQLQARNNEDPEGTPVLGFNSDPTRGSSFIELSRPLKVYDEYRGLSTQLKTDSIDCLNPQQSIELLKSAAEKGDLEQVMAICTRHQNLLNAEDTGGYTPLYHASRCGHADVVNFLLSHGSLVDNQSRISGDTPLMGAVSHGHLEVVRLLLQRGADPKKRNSSGVDALECMDRYSPNRTAIEEAIKAVLQARPNTEQDSDTEHSAEMVNEEQHIQWNRPTVLGGEYIDRGGYERHTPMSRFLEPSDREDDPPAYLTYLLRPESIREDRSRSRNSSVTTKHECEYEDASISGMPPW